MSWASVQANLVSLLSLSIAKLTSNQEKLFIQHFFLNTDRKNWRFSKVILIRMYIIWIIFNHALNTNQIWEVRSLTNEIHKSRI